MKKSLFFAIAILGLSTATSVYAISITGNVSAVIKAAITAIQTQQMNFGTISSAATAGTVTLSPAGVRTSTLQYYNTAAAGTFTITAAPSTALTVTYGNGTLTSGANNMTVSNFTSSSTPASNTTDGSGNLTLNVGADLAVGANQPSGSYAGTYTVTLSY